MKKYFCKTSVTLISVLILTGCSTSHKSFINRNGEDSHVTSCSGASWFDCLNEAGKICGKKGYEITERTSNKIYGFFSNTDFKEVIFVCKTESVNKIDNSSAPPSKPRDAIATQAGEIGSGLNKQSSSAQQPSTELNKANTSSDGNTPPSNNTLNNQKLPVNEPLKLEKGVTQDKNLGPQDNNVVINKINELTKSVINP